MPAPTMVMFTSPILVGGWLVVSGSWLEAVAGGRRRGRLPDYEPPTTIHQLEVKPQRKVDIASAADVRRSAEERRLRVAAVSRARHMVQHVGGLHRQLHAV